MTHSITELTRLRGQLLSQARNLDGPGGGRLPTFHVGCNNRMNGDGGVREHSIREAAPTKSPYAAEDAPNSP